MYGEYVTTILYNCGTASSHVQYNSSHLPTLGTVIVKQVYTDTSTSWPVEGVATYNFSGCCPVQFDFQCLTNNDSLILTWRKGSESVVQSIITGGVKFTLPTLSSAGGVYTCTAMDSNFNNIDSVNINITGGECITNSDISQYNLCVTNLHAK